MKEALVTGDKGFVGRHFVRYLRNCGWNVLTCDVKDGHDARTLWQTTGWREGGLDLVVHCAAVVGGREMIDGAPLALAANLELDAGLFQWAMRVRPARVLYFSSSSVYPVYEQVGVRARPLPEHMVRAALDIPSVGVPDQLYGWAKLTGEHLAHRARATGLNISVVRPFSGYGSDQDASYPFAAFIDRALRREDPFTIWSAGDQVRDFIHIDDIVRACMAMYEQGIDGPVNLGTSRGTTMTELASMVCAHAHYKPGFKFDLAAPRGVTCRVADASLLREFCEPEVTLERGIAQALAWRRRNRQSA